MTNIAKLNGGNCFEAAAAFVLDNSKAVLVHGRPTLTRHPYKPYVHAWAEIKINGTIFVREVSNGLDITVPKELYYQCGNINKNECLLYTCKQIRRLILKTEHWGPWELKYVEEDF